MGGRGERVAPNGWLIAITAVSLLAGAYATLKAARTERNRSNNESRSQAFSEAVALLEQYRTDNNELRQRNSDLERRKGLNDG